MIGAKQAGEVAAVLRQAAQTHILPRFRRLSQGAVRSKSGPLDLVTDADEAAERLITAELLRLFPGWTVIGEEATAADNALLDRLAGADRVFVVDPIDGTANFAAGVPLFGCMAAALREGEVVAAWIHDPLGDDTAIALRGEGAWLADPQGRPLTALRVAQAVPLERMIATVSWTYLHEPLRSQIASRLARFGAVLGFRCAAHEYRLTASGHAHIQLYARLMPWDHLPGWLLHHEAGGFAARFDGSPYRPGQREGGLICAPDRASWNLVRHLLFGP